jgi:hypothetical protein
MDIKDGAEFSENPGPIQFNGPIPSTLSGWRGIGLGEQGEHSFSSTTFPQNMVRPDLSG